MLEKPAVSEEAIITCVRGAYGLHGVQVTFLPLGADADTAVYRLRTRDGAAYFLKLRGDSFDAISVALPRFLSDQGVTAVIPSLPTRTGRLWADLAPFKLILYPFITGQNGYEAGMFPAQWTALGTALKTIHTTSLPPSMQQQLRREAFSPRWREMVQRFLAQAARETFTEAIAMQTAALLQDKRNLIRELVRRADRLAGVLQAQPPPFTLCHADLHAGNILLAADGALYIVDWDDPILAPRERDLMYVGGGLLGRWHPPREEATLFYSGYGRTRVDPIALAYYRYERIIEDIALFCRQLLLRADGGADRAQSFHYLQSNFLPGHTIDVAFQSDEVFDE